MKQIHAIMKLTNAKNKKFKNDALQRLQIRGEKLKNNA